MPGVRPVVPVLIDSGSASSLDNSPSDSFRRKSLLAESGRAPSICDVQLKEDLAEAMKEDHGCEVPTLSRVEPVTAEGAGSVGRAVDPAGTVVARGPSPSPQPPTEHAIPNADEATFRPVVRAPAPPTLPPLVARPLPRTTTIPVQTVPITTLSPEEPLPLNTDVVIPAAFLPIDLHFQDPQDFDNVPLDEPEQKPEVALDRVNLDKRNVNRDLERECYVRKRDSGHESGSVEAGRESKVITDTLPKSNTDDIQPIASIRLTKSPTLKSVSDKKVSDINVNDILPVGPAELKEVRGSVPIEIKKTEVKLVRKERDWTPVDMKKNYDKESVSTESKKIDDTKQVGKVKVPVPAENMKFEEIKKPGKVRDSMSVKNKNSDEVKRVGKVKDYVSPDNRKNIEVKQVEKGKDSMLAENKKRDENAKIREPGRVYVKKNEDVKQIIKKKETVPAEVTKIEEVKQDFPEDENVEIITKVRSTEDLKSLKLEKVRNEIETDKYTDTKKTYEVSSGLPSKVTDKGSASRVFNFSANSVELKMVETETNDSKELFIKNEEQAWDMLISESGRPALLEIGQKAQAVSGQYLDDKPSKKTRKPKKAHDDSKVEGDDSFVEIHAIEDKQQFSSGDLVSISSSFQDIPSTAYVTKNKKSRITKSLTPERKAEQRHNKICYQAELQPPPKVSSKAEPIPKVEVLHQFSIDSPVEQTVNTKNDKSVETAIQSREPHVNEKSRSSQESSRTSKSKSLSPYIESRKPIDVDKKDVYVINTTDDDSFPDIQITKSNKSLKRSPQCEKKLNEKELSKIKPVKSWSSIAATKCNTKTDATENKLVTSDSQKNILDKSGATTKGSETLVMDDDNTSIAPDKSFQDKLFEICKRTDIMVAKCDAPSELTFVEGHHAAPEDLPPLEGLDFGLDDFNLEVMRDSLMEVKDNKAQISSPICKINIDDILTSIKETTSKAIESSSFNLIDLEKLPNKREKGFNVVGGHKIISQDVLLDDDPNTKEKRENMDKSSDDEIAAVALTDSDKEDKRNYGASNILQPSPKQSAKSKKSRRKKK